MAATIVLGPIIGSSMGDYIFIGRTRRPYFGLANATATTRERKIRLKFGRILDSYPES